MIKDKPKGKQLMKEYKFVVKANDEYSVDDSVVASSENEAWDVIVWNYREYVAPWVDTIELVED
jgi:hypothetical protein